MTFGTRFVRTLSIFLCLLTACPEAKCTLYSVNVHNEGANLRVVVLQVPVTSMEREGTQIILMEIIHIFQRKYHD